MGEGYEGGKGVHVGLWKSGDGSGSDENILSTCMELKKQMED